MSEQLTTEGIQDFLEKYKNAKGFNSKEMRLTIQEAERLTAGIALLLSRYQRMADQVIELQAQLLDPQEVIMSGGGFS
jgi:hypothetical protein